jgi:hypothetical protein
MNYLRCQHCEHNNALRSEFLTFCEQCGKKLPYTFADWKQKHPLGEFEAFQREVAIYIDDTPPKPGWVQQYLWPAGRRGVMLALGLIFALVAVAGTYFGKEAVLTWFFPKVSKAWMYTSWETVTIGRQAMEISAPVHLRVSDKPLPADLNGMVEYAKSYANQQGGGMQIMVDMFSFKESASNSLDDANTIAIKGIQQEAGVSELQYTSAPMPQTDVQGVMQEGSYLYKNAVKLSFYNLIMVKGQHRWLVSIRYRADDTAGQEIAKRVFNSVKVKPFIVRN